MKNKVWIIVAVAFVAVMITAAVLYPKLSQNYSGEDSLDKTNSGSAIKADDFTVYDAQMNPVKLSNYFGKPIIINFWASWCGPCKVELPAFDAMHKKYGDDVVFLMVNLTDGQNDTVSSIKKFVKDAGYTFPVYYDVKYDASNTYGVYSIPETVFISADGSLYDTRVGAISEKILENYIKKLLGE